MKKTNAMRILEEHKVIYDAYSYKIKKDEDVIVEKEIGKPRELIYKTLVTESKSKEHYVFIIPIDKELDLKRAASAVEEKSVSMLHQKDLLPLTGYVHGGCSPFGMKKQFKTVLDDTAQGLDYIIVSAGARGAHVGLNPEEIIRVAPASFASVSVDKHH